jgi:two-component system nitrogen regulation response regulator NtrX
MAPSRILVVDDEQGVRSSLSAVLGDEGFEVETAASGEECLGIVKERSFEAILLDIWLPGRDGLETLKSLRRMGVDASVVMISGHGTIETAVRATKLGAHDFVEKPLSLEKILLTLKNALRAKKLEEKNRLLREELRRDTELIGESPGRALSGNGSSRRPDRRRGPDRGRPARKSSWRG